MRLNRHIDEFVFLTNLTGFAQAAEPRQPPDPSTSHFAICPPPPLKTTGLRPHSSVRVSTGS